MERRKVLRLFLASSVAAAISPNFVFGKIVYLDNVSTEKYGRILADVYLGDLHINKWMLSNKYAIEYDGGTKKIPDEWK